MTRTPPAVWIVDTKKEHLAVDEARKLRHPGHRHPRHQLRPRRGRLPDPGQRRRDPRGRLLTRVVADAVADGPDGPLRRQDRPTGDRPSSAPRSRWPTGSASCCRVTPPGQPRGDRCRGTGARPTEPRPPRRRRRGARGTRQPGRRGPRRRGADRPRRRRRSRRSGRAPAADPQADAAGRRRGRTAVTAPGRARHARPPPARGSAQTWRTSPPLTSRSSATPPAPG